MLPSLVCALLPFPHLCVCHLPCCSNLHDPMSIHSDVLTKQQGERWWEGEADWAADDNGKTCPSVSNIIYKILFYWQNIYCLAKYLQQNLGKNAIPNLKICYNSSFLKNVNKTEINGRGKILKAYYHKINLLLLTIFIKWFFLAVFIFQSETFAFIRKCCYHFVIPFLIDKKCFVYIFSHTLSYEALIKKYRVFSSQGM